MNRANPKRATANIWKKKTKENLESHARGRNSSNHGEAARRMVVSSAVTGDSNCRMVIYFLQSQQPE